MMKKYKYSCELLLRNRFKKFTGEIEADSKGEAIGKVFDYFHDRYNMGKPLEFEKSIVVKEVAQI